MPCRPRFFPVLAGLLMATGASAASVLAQAPPVPAAAEAPAPPLAPPAPPPPPPPVQDGLFPAPDAARPAPPPVPATGELRAAGRRGARRGKASNLEGGRASGGRRRAAANPALLTAAGDPVEIRIAYRRAETEAKRDPVFNDLLRRADLAPDDEERRALLRRYYTELFTRVRRINSSPALATHVAVLSRAAESRYAPKRRVGGPDENDAGQGRGGGQR